MFIHFGIRFDFYFRILFSFKIPASVIVSSFFCTSSITFSINKQCISCIKIVVHKHFKLDIWTRSRKSTPENKANIVQKISLILKIFWRIIAKKHDFWRFFEFFEKIWTFHSRKCFGNDCCIEDKFILDCFYILQSPKKGKRATLFCVFYKAIH